MVTCILAKLRSGDDPAILNADLAALFQFGQQWFMDFAPLNTRSLLISLKRDTFDHPPLFMNNRPIAEVSSLKILGFMLDSSFTWGPHIDMIISRTKQRLAQLCCLSSYFCWFIYHVQIFCLFLSGVWSSSLFWRC